MDRTSIIVVALCFALIVLWTFVLMPKLYPPKPLPPGSTNLVGATLTATNQPGTSSVAPPNLEAAPPAPVLIADTNVPEQLEEITNDNAHYTFTSHGGGLKQIELIHYPETTSTRRDKSPETNRVATLNSFTPAPTLALLGGDAIQGDGIFKLTRTANGVHAEKTLTNGLTIVKDFELSTNYLVSATIRFENHTTQPLNLPAQQWIVGTATPMGPDDNGQSVGVLWCNGSKATDIGASYFSPRGFACIPRTPPAEYRGGTSNVVWAAVHNRFFALAAMPQQPALEVITRKLDLPPPPGDGKTSTATNGPPAQGFVASLQFPAFTLTPDKPVERHFFLYAGPKEYQTLARLSVSFDNNLDLVMNFSWAGFVSKPLLLGMNWLHHVLKFSYAWAIITITLIIKAVFWPLTQASTRSMKRMQLLQPQMKAIQEKYKDDPVKMNRKVMEFMREHKASPLGGCLPMLLQIPVFIGFYQMIQSAIELRGAHFLWIGDLSKPDTLFYIPGTNLPFNLLPLIMGGTMLWQAHLAPPSPSMDPAQQKLMRYMPLMFMVFLYNYSSGLALYWTVQNLLSIAQTKLTRTEPESALTAKVPVLTPPQKKRK